MDLTRATAAARTALARAVDHDHPLPAPLSLPEDGPVAVVALFLLTLPWELCAVAGAVEQRWGDTPWLGRLLPVGDEQLPPAHPTLVYDLAFVAVGQVALILADEQGRDAEEVALGAFGGAYAILTAEGSERRDR